MGYDRPLRSLPFFHQIKVKSDRNMNKHIGLEEEMSRLNDRISEAAHGVQRNVFISREIIFKTGKPQIKCFLSAKMPTVANANMRKYISDPLFLIRIKRSTLTVLLKQKKYGYSINDFNSTRFL